MKQFTISLLAATVATLAIASSAFAATTTCQPIYGGGESCVTSDRVKIDKKVSHPKTGAYTDNLGSNDPFAPTQTLNFQLVVTNISNGDLSKVTVKDIFPQYVTFVSGVGNFNEGAKTLSFDVSDLKKGESRTFTLTAKVADANAVPSDVCVVNQGQVLVDNTLEWSDNAQLCIAKALQAPVVTKGGLKVFPPAQVKTTPPTGPEMIALAGLLPTGVLGYFLRKKASL